MSQQGKSPKKRIIQPERKKYGSKKKREQDYNIALIECADALERIRKITDRSKEVQREIEIEQQSTSNPPAFNQEEGCSIDNEKANTREEIADGNDFGEDDFEEPPILFDFEGEEEMQATYAALKESSMSKEERKKLKSSWNSVPKDVPIFRGSPVTLFVVAGLLLKLQHRYRVVFCLDLLLSRCVLIHPSE